MVPAGIGFSQRLFEMHIDMLRRALELVSASPSEDGCPSCVGPGGENGMGGKRETIEILKLLAIGDKQLASCAGVFFPVCLSHQGN
ncbi:MAG: DUF1998 domain-containing protein [Chloroflexi bacterium]|nr:DUF1998 domain-containing protein [Chloroflexota bacterium]